MAFRQSHPAATRRDLLAGCVLLVTLLVCNSAFTASHGWAHVAWSLLGYGGLLCSYYLARLSLSDIGLAPTNMRTGLRYGGVVVLALIGVVSVAFIVDSQAFHDPRYHQSLERALYDSLILLPLKTVFFEELAFRGLLLAIGRRLTGSQLAATILSSLLFGLWHISTAGGVGSYSLGNNIVLPKAVVYVAVLTVTALAGALFCELRWRSHSLLAPLVVHWFINGFAIVLIALSWTQAK